MSRPQIVKSVFMAGTALVLTLFASAQPLRDVNIQRFLLVSACCVGIISVLCEVLFPVSPSQLNALALLKAGGRGMLVGTLLWITITSVTMIWSDRGDKFPLFVSFYVPFAAGLGLVAGISGRLLRRLFRS